MSDSAILRLSLLAVLLTAGLSVMPNTQASDRDTPAYRIYVDPVTGRYTTKPPADTATTKTRADTAQNVSPTAVSNTRPGNPADIRRPLAATAILVLIAGTSLLMRKQPAD